MKFMMKFCFFEFSYLIIELTLWGYFHKKYDEWLRYDKLFIDPEYVAHCCTQSVHLYLKPDISLTGPSIQSMSM